MRYVLKKQLHCDDPALLAAALFHSIYGTEGFQGQTLPLSERPKLQALIGQHGEFLAYLNCVMDRASLDQAVTQFQQEEKSATTSTTTRTYPIFSREELGKEKIALSKKQLLDLLRVHLADWAQQVAAYSFWSYRREAYATIAAVLGGVHKTVHASIMATEPANSEENLPEMVRARKLGVFDKVMKGDMTYEELIDSKNDGTDLLST